MMHEHEQEHHDDLTPIDDCTSLPPEVRRALRNAGIVTAEQLFARLIVDRFAQSDIIELDDAARRDVWDELEVLIPGPVRQRLEEAAASDRTRDRTFGVLPPTDMPENPEETSL